MNPWMNVLVIACSLNHMGKYDEVWCNAMEWRREQADMEDLEEDEDEEAPKQTNAASSSGDADESPRLRAGHFMES